MQSAARHTVVVDGMALAQELRGEIAAEVAALVAAGRRPPCLAVVLVGLGLSLIGDGLADILRPGQA